MYLYNTTTFRNKRLQIEKRKKMKLEQKSNSVQKLESELSASMILSYRIPYKMNELYKEDLTPIICWLKLFIKPGKTLVYFASGTHIQDEYKNLNYENVILVDYSFKNCSYDGEKVICLGLDAIVAVSVLRQLSVKIDCLVTINEGLYEGGGRYSLNSDSFLGYCFPLFSDKLIHLGIKDYYCGNEYFHQRTHYLDLPYNEKKILTPIDEGYISPSIFSTEGYRAIVTLLEKKSGNNYSFKYGRIIVNVKHASIFDFENKLDVLFVQYENNCQKMVFEKLEPKLIDLRSFTKENNKFSNDAKNSINELCINNQYEKIGFIPCGVNYMDLINSLSEHYQNGLKEVFFFHLNKDDFSDLYMRKQMDIR